MTDQFTFDLQPPKSAPDKAARQAERLRNLKARYGRKAIHPTGNVVNLEARRRELAERTRSQRLRELRFRALAEGGRSDDRDQA